MNVLFGEIASLTVIEIEDAQVLLRKGIPYGNPNESLDAFSLDEMMICKSIHPDHCIFTIHIWNDQFALSQHVRRHPTFPGFCFYDTFERHIYVAGITDVLNVENLGAFYQWVNDDPVCLCDGSRRLANFLKGRFQRIWLGAAQNRVICADKTIAFLLLPERFPYQTAIVQQSLQMIEHFLA